MTKPPGQLLRLDALLGKLEQQVMVALWQLKKATVREVLEILRQQRKIAYTTVMTVMDNLFRKGYLAREKCGRAYCYTPKYAREELIEDNLSQIVQRLLDEYEDLAAVQFIKQSEKLDPRLKEKLLTELENQDE